MDEKNVYRQVDFLEEMYHWETHNDRPLHDVNVIDLSGGVYWKILVVASLNTIAINKAENRH